MKREKEKKLIVILPGGGAKSYFQVGAWNYILNSGINFGSGQTKVHVPNGVFSISGGSIVGAFIAMGKNAQMFKFYNQVAGNPSEVYTSDFLKQHENSVKLDTEAIIKYLLSGLNRFQKAGLLFKRSRRKVLRKIMDKVASIDALTSNAPLFEKLKHVIRVKDIKSEVFQAGYVSLMDGQYYSVPHTDFNSDFELQKAVLASTSMPLVWSPIGSIATKDYETSHLIDGGIRNVTPFGDAVKFVNEQSDNAEYYFLVITPHTEAMTKMQEKPNLLNIATRGIYDIAMNEIQHTDLSEFIRINALVKQAQRKGIDLYSKNGRKLREFKLKIIRPSRNLGFALNFSRSLVMDSYLHGFQQAKNVVQCPVWE